LGSGRRASRGADAGAARLQTLCVEGHNLTIVAADAVPTKPLSVTCLDINLGQRCARATLLPPYAPLAVLCPDEGRGPAVRAIAPTTPAPACGAGKAGGAFWCQRT